MHSVNLIVVEDEPAILSGIAAQIKRMDLPISITGIYLNGTEALKDLSNSKPDLIITDVQMPVMTGLELISRLKEQQYPAEYLVLSGYAEFEYVQKALRLNVSNYLLKPLRFRELQESLSEVCSRILSRRHEQELLSLQNLFFPSQDSKASSLPLPEGPYRLFLYQEGPFLDIPLEVSIQQSFFSSRQLELSLEQAAGRSFDYLWILDTPKPGLKLLLFGGTDSIALSPEQFFNLLETLSSVFPSTTLVSGKLITDSRELLDAYGKAMEQLSCSAVFGKHQLVFFTASCQARPASLSKVSRDLLLKVLSSRNPEQVAKQYHFFAEIWKKEAFGQFQIFSFTQDVFSELFHHSDTANPASLEKETTDKLVQLAFDAADTDTFLLSAELLLESVCQTLFHTSPDATILQAVDALWNYIDQHFTQELDINAYAKEHGYHPVYLISQFSKLKQISPSKRITQKKLALAKELLKNSDMSLQEIVNTVGFYDISYFSRLFKSQEGMTPGAFRKSFKTPKDPF